MYGVIYMLAGIGFDNVYHEFQLNEMILSRAASTTSLHAYIINCWNLAWLRYGKPLMNSASCNFKTYTFYYAPCASFPAFK